jgi:lactoylglutathione lyase
MLNIRGVYEVAIRVRDLERAEQFYKGVLGLEEGTRDEARR